MTVVTLISQDDQEITVSKDAIMLSVTIKNMVEDLGDVDAPIPIANIDMDILKHVVEFCEYKHKNPDPKLKFVPTENDESDKAELEKLEEDERFKPLKGWDLEFINRFAPKSEVGKESDLTKIVIAANYLDIKSLLDIACKRFASYIKGKTTEEIREIFGIINDFTPEEEEQIRKENAWCEA